MPTWIDDEGRLRERADERHQFLRHIPLEFLDPWISYDSWSAELAIRLITIGYDLDINGHWDEAKDFPYGSTGWDSAFAYVDVYSRGMAIAQSSIAADRLKDPDTPANWLAWAKRKGYDVAHLEHSQKAPETDTAKPAPDTVRPLQRSTAPAQTKTPAPVAIESAPKPKSNSQWWEDSYDIPELWQNIGATLYSQKKRTSNTAIAKGIETRINDIERSKGRDRVSPDSDTIRGKLTGWKWENH